MVKKYISDLKAEFTGYNPQKFTKDFFAGITTCAVALPLALAFGVSNGVDAAAGLISAIIAGIVIALLGGASFQISGPTGTMTAVFLVVSAQFGVQGIFAVTMFSGVILIIIGILKLGRFVTLIPSPVITGFTSGVACIIALGQFDNILGMTSTGSNPIFKLFSYFNSNQSVNLTSLFITLGVIVFMIVYPKKLNEKLPSSLASIIIMFVICQFVDLPVATIGNIPNTLLLPNRLSLSSIEFASISSYIAPAFSIACLVLIETLLCGTCAADLKNENIDCDREVIAQGIGNVMIPFFGGVPATAALARTSVAIKSGSQTRLCSVVNSLGLIACMLFLGSQIGAIPLNVLSGVLLVTAFRMNNWGNIKALFEHKFKTSLAMYFITMICTIIFDLTTAVIIGVIVATVAYVYKSSRIEIEYQDIDLSRMKVSADVVTKNWGVVYITGPLFFLTSETVKNSLENLNDEITIFSMRGVAHADDVGAQIIFDYIKKEQALGHRVIFACVQNEVKTTFDRLGISELIGDDFYFTVNKALDILIDEESAKA